MYASRNVCAYIIALHDKGSHPKHQNNACCTSVAV